MSNYTSRIYGNFYDFLSDVPNNTDRVQMKKHLTPFINELMKKNIKSPYSFVEIMKAFNLSRSVITDFLIQILNLKSKSPISSRLLNHTNSFEKNAILTYQALMYPKIMQDCFTEFVSMKYPHFQNKDSLFSKINNEIMKIKDESLKDISQNAQSNSNDELISESINQEEVDVLFDDQDSEIMFGYFDEFDCGFLTYDDDFNADVIEY